MKVEALTDGFIRPQPGRRPVRIVKGTVFEKPDTVPLGRWMRPVAAPAGATGGESSAGGPGPAASTPRAPTAKTGRRATGDTEVL